MWDKLDRLAPREQLGLLLAGLFLFALMIKQFVVQGIINQCRDFDQAIQVVQVKVAGNEKILELGPVVERDYKMAQGRLSRITTTDEAIVDLKGQIDDLARRTGVSLLSMDHAEPVSREGLTEFSVLVGSFESDMKNLLSFLQEVQAAPGLVRVEKLSVSPGKTKQSVKGSMRLTRMLLPAET